MQREIERRFLVKKAKWKEEKGWHPTVLAQSYLLATKRLTVRVRIAGKKAYLTIKHKVAGRKGADEYEYPLPLSDATKLLRLGKYRVTKTRWVKGRWEVDVFKGPNAPLIIAEIELRHAKESVRVPVWCGREVTGIRKYANSRLGKKPFQKWS